MKQLKYLFGIFMLVFMNALPMQAFAVTTVFYVVAHEDDWQLFMNPNALYDAQNPNVHIVFIHLTAGDGGYNTGFLPNNGSVPYYLGREEGAMRAIRLATNTNANLTYGSGTNYTTSYVYPASHQLVRRTYNNASIYFLRLPDGGDTTGTGYPADHYQTLKALYVGPTNGGISVITSIDGSTTFNGWSDLTNTLRELVAIEAGTSSTIVANYQDPAQGGATCTFNSVGPVDNCNDHMDHMMTGLAFQQAISNSPCIYQVKYIDYGTQGMASNLSATDTMSKAAAWGATVSGMTDSMELNDWNATYNQYISRTYFSTVQGSNTCNLQ